MAYQIQYRDADLDHDWESMNNSGDNLGTMKAAVDELIETAQMRDITQTYRLVDEAGSVVYAPDGPRGVQADGSNSLM